jgi:hypothetical protein
MLLRIMQSKRKHDVTADELALESIQEELLPALNDGPKTVQMARIEKLLTLLGRLKQDATSREKIEAFTALRNLLGEYRWVSYIAPWLDGFVVINQIADHMRITKADLWEHKAVRDLLNAFPRLGIGKRPYIRRCENDRCQRWFLARRGDKRTCSPACHVCANRSPEQRLRKAKYMKNLRKDQQNRREREDKRLGFTKGKRRVVSTKSR